METTKPSPWRTTKKLRGMCFLPHTHPKPPVKAHTSHTHATHPHRHKARLQNLGMYIQHCLSQRCTFGISIFFLPQNNYWASQSTFFSPKLSFPWCPHLSIRAGWSMGESGRTLAQIPRSRSRAVSLEAETSLRSTSRVSHRVDRTRSRR